MLLSKQFSLKTRVLYALRRLGLYRGPIHFVYHADPISFGIDGKGL